MLTLNQFAHEILSWAGLKLTYFMVFFPLAFQIFIIFMIEISGKHKHKLYFYICEKVKFDIAPKKTACITKCDEEKWRNTICSLLKQASSVDYLENICYSKPWWALKGHLLVWNGNWYWARFITLSIGTYKSKSNYEAYSNETPFGIRC